MMKSRQANTELQQEAIFESKAQTMTLQQAQSHYNNGRPVELDADRQAAKIRGIEPMMPYSTTAFMWLVRRFFRKERTAA
jgi:hypothetical protein